MLKPPFFALLIHNPKAFFIKQPHPSPKNIFLYSRRVSIHRATPLQNPVCACKPIEHKKNKFLLAEKLYGIDTEKYSQKQINVTKINLKGKDHV